MQSLPAPRGLPWDLIQSVGEAVHTHRHVYRRFVTECDTERRRGRRLQQQHGVWGVCNQQGQGCPVPRASTAYLSPRPPVAAQLGRRRMPQRGVGRAAAAARTSWEHRRARNARRRDEVQRLRAGMPMDPRPRSARLEIVAAPPLPAIQSAR